VAEYVFSWDDTFVDVNGVVKNFKDVGTSVAVIIPLPPGAIVQGGEVVTEQAWTGGTCNIALGDVGPPVVPAVPVPARYMASTAVTAAGRLATSIVPTGYVSLGENLQMTVIIGTATATAGKTSVKVSYIIRDRANEVNTV
jgi:hypothetical protein